MTTEPKWTPGNLIADAHLIASAQRLFQIVETILSSINSGGPVVTFQDVDIEEMEAALAKARGESND